MAEKKKSNLIYGKDDEEISLEKARVDLKSRGVSPEEKKSFSKSIINVLNGQGDIERLAFEADPSQVNNYAGVYKSKVRLIPDTILKRIAIQDSLVSNIVRARQNHISSFGRPRPDRFSLGFMIKPNTGLLDKLDTDGKEALQKEIKDAIDLLSSCGHTKGISDEHQSTFAEYLSLSARSAVVCGRIATEIVWAADEKTSNKKRFHHFVATDSGTIYPATNDESALESVRREAYNLLCKVTGQKLIREKYNEGDYKWVQVVDGSPKQVFTSEEMVCYNFYAVPDVELGGFPVSPLDTVISAVTTHINITTLNKLWFQNGRASKGMLVIKSEDANPSTIHTIKQNFNASINSVNAAFRMPVFGCGIDEEIQWQPLDVGSGRDMEYQYLADSNAREILTAFMMSPDELPGWTYLSRGTNNQALCLALESKIYVPGGLYSIQNILGDKSEKQTPVWTGTQWVDGRVFLTGEKLESITKLGNGASLKTSPDHRYRIVNENGCLDWKAQKDLAIGDSVVVNRHPVKSMLRPPSYKGKKLTPEMMEVLGWLTGDGNISVRYMKSTGNIKQGVFSWFYHHSKERDLWEKHNEILCSWGLSPKHLEKTLSEEEREETKGRYGFDSVAKTRLKNVLYDTDFLKWILSLGFSPSCQGKVIPPFIHGLPDEYRLAFLRGFWSADGTLINQAGGSKIGARIVIHDDRLRSQMRDLLLTVGIRTQCHEGLKKQVFVKGTKRAMVDGASSLCVKDKVLFFEKVGFLQAHKQPSQESMAGCPCVYDKIPAVLAKVLTVGMGSVKNVARTWRTGCSRKFLKASLASVGRNCPSWVDDYFYEEVVEVSEFPTSVLMADVEVFDDEHAFVANGIITHNSESNNQYVLEASRDVGIRPLLAGFEDFVNAHLFPLIAPNLVDKCQVKFVGLEADNAEKEAVRTQQDMGIWMTFDEVLERVEKKPLGKEWGGGLPLNQIFKSYLDQYFTVGQILEHFCGIKDATKDPSLAYRRDPFAFQWIQVQQAQQQMQAQAQAQQQQQAQGGGQGGGDSQGGQSSGGQVASDPNQAGADPAKGANAYGQQTEKEKSAQDSSAEGSGSSPSVKSGANDLARSIDQAFDLLQKKESQLPPDKRKLIAQQEKTVDFFMKGWGSDVDEALQVILGVAEHHTPKGKA